VRCVPLDTITVTLPVLFLSFIGLGVSVCPPVTVFALGEARHD
jgi:hypothetical protein